MGLIPKEFQPRIHFRYPPDNSLIFEEWYYKACRNHVSEREYLPIFWTSYYVNHQFGKNTAAIQKLQNFIDQLPKKKYYTICQFDDGILNDLSGFDIEVFSMSGGGITIPLISEPHRYKFDGGKKYLANFIGKITHPIRNKLIEAIPNNSNYYISTAHHKMDKYCKAISESLFTLCPRGYGKTSFRIQEAIQYGSIPVYISDEFVLPEKFNQYGICLSDVNKIDEYLSEYSFKEIMFAINLLPKIYQDYFTYDAVKNYIHKCLKNEKEEKEKSTVAPQLS